MKKAYIDYSAANELFYSCIKRHAETTSREQLEQEYIDLKMQEIHKKEEERMRRLKKFETESEKLGPLFNESEFLQDQASPEELKEPAAEDMEVQEEPEPEKKKKRPRRADSGVQVIEKHNRLDPEEQFCPLCHAQMTEMPAGYVDKLIHVPERFYIERTYYYTYVCPQHCEDEEGRTIMKSSRPDTDRVFEGSIVTPSVISWIASSKFVMGTPLYRIEQEMERKGIALSRKKMSDWLLKGVAGYWQILYDQMMADFRQMETVHLDETSLKVLKVPDGLTGTTSARNCSMIAGCSGPRESKKMSLYLYSRDKSAEFVGRFLGPRFRGALMSDGNPSYTSYVATHGWQDAETGEIRFIQHLNCNVHARREFVKALEGRAEHKVYQKLKTAEERKEFLSAHSSYAKLKRVVDLYGKLYQIEKKIRQTRDITIEQIREQRQAEAKPIFEQLTEAVKVVQAGFVGGSLGAKAASYFLKRKDSLALYLEDGRYPIDNNPAERAVKPFVIGRKNFLFCNTETGAQASAVLYSLVETAKANGLNVERYLSYTLEQMVKADFKTADIESLLPYAEELPKELYIDK